MIALIYPHQLYDDQPALAGVEEVWLIEEPLFFRQVAFHRQKLILHRATMQEYAAELSSRGYRVCTVESRELSETGQIAHLLRQAGWNEAQVVELNDNWLNVRLRRACEEEGLRLSVLSDPNWLTTPNRAENWLHGKGRYYFSDFYVQQRKALGILLESDGSPVGGKWTFDTDNRKRLPKSLLIPKPFSPKPRNSVLEAEAYVKREFPHARGITDAPFQYSVSRADALTCLEDFLDNRLHDFGAYEDAMSASEDVLFHSVLTPMLNIGLLKPDEVIRAAMARQGSIPLNSLEGFIRQVLGWREYVRVMYHQIGSKQRTRNFLGHAYPLPESFYDGTTGIAPFDIVVHRVLRSGYCHHIERLMVLGAFMALVEIHPDAVYQWFMEMFIDAYDWVMVPNVYGMSQYADGGLMTTKPYVCGSNYILKMSDFAAGPWCEIWDALYWRFINKHRELFLKNPRLSLAVRSLDKMGPREPELLARADMYLRQLHGELR